MHFKASIFFASFALLSVISNIESASDYFGKYIGPLKTYHHGVTGDVYVVDSRTLHIRNLNYDGEGPAAYFYVSNGKTPNESGTKLRDERGSNTPLKKYRKKHVTLTLPEGKTVTNIKHFYIWCDEFSVNFADIKIPKNLDFPKPQKIGKLEGVHEVSSDNVLVVDAQTLLIPSFSYDGEAPDAKFWVGSGNKPSPQGIKVPDENGKEDPLRKYVKKTIVLTLPGDLTIFDIGHFGVWCEAFTVDFGHLLIPKNLNVPPSLKMLGVSPQSKLNCEILYDDLAFEVRWAVAGDSIVIQLVAKLEKGEYMSFGVSGQIDRNTMVGGDVVVAWIDHETLNGYAYDYYLDAKSQCAGTRGSCPDIKLRTSTESIRLLNAALVNGYSIVTYQRPLRAHDEFDLPIYTNGSQAIIWAIGPLNSLQEVSYHSITSKATTLIDFGRPPQWNCPIPESDAAIADTETSERYNEPVYTTSEQYQVHTETSVRTRVTEQQKKERETTKTTPVSKKVEATPAPVKREKPWDIPPIQCNEPDDGVYYAQMGPTGGKRGYSAITGHVGWGISWYINGLLIPEINVVRGRTYTFVVEGGLDPEIPAKYHPFYITDDPVGGFVYKTPEEKEKIQLFAGVTQNKDGEYVPTGIGRLCNWTPDPDQPSSDEFTSFGAYQRTLSLVCDHGEPGVIQWTPDENTPDTVYYQCFSHRYLGWKINVHDTCDKDVAESEQVTTRVRADSDADQDELISNPSIQVITRVKPANASLYNSLADLKQEGKNNLILEPGQFKDGLKGEFAQSERFILQDPYMPPPPYQKNFDYQTMQSTEPMREIKPITERVYPPRPQDIPLNKNYPQDIAINKNYPQDIAINKNYPQDIPLKGYPQDIPLKGYPQDLPLKGFPQDVPPKGYPQDIPQKIYNPYYINTTTPQVAYIPTNMLKYPKTHFKEPYALPTNNMKIPLFADSPYKYQIPPAMHIHVIKHAGEQVDDQVPAMSKPYPVGRPYRHSVVIKKPLHKVKPPPYSHVRVNKIPKQNGEQQVASSNSVKSVLPPSIRNVVSKIPPQTNIPIQAHVYTPTTPARKPYVPHHASTRKKEEPQVQAPVKQYLSKLEEHPDNHKYPSPPTQGGFNPSSIVIESGFKPIIPNIDTQNVAQDRMSEDVEDYIEQDPPSKDFNITEIGNDTVSDDHSKNPFEGKEPELFEPIFIPSPLINEHHRKKKPHDQPMKVKLHKPGQSNIVYIWPNEEEDSPNVPNEQPSYFNYYAIDTVSAPIYNKPYDKNESPQGTDNLVENISYQMPSKQPSTSHTYKVTELHENMHPEVSEMNNSTERTIPDGEKIPSNHKIKYIPVSYNADNDSQDDKFVINIPDNQSTESTNSTKS